MDAITQQNAACAEQSASASSELKSQTEVLRNGAAELEAIVGTLKSARAETPTPAYQGPARTGRGHTTERTQASQRTGSGKPLNRTHKQAGKKESNEQALPLDEENAFNPDFSDFTVNL
jgi:hypothetical protein